MTNHPSTTYTCIVCGNDFLPVDPAVGLCPACGGPLAVAPPDLKPTMESDQPQGEKEDARAETEARVEPKGRVAGVKEWQPGDVILDTYEVKGVLGQGGYGKVYRVHHRAWNVDLAVKRSLNLEESARQSFVDEAEKWIDLGLHPHIVTCYYVRNIDGFPHTFAELAEGGSLKDWIEGEERKLYAGGSAAALERILDIAIQFAWGLGYAHDQGLVHQDVKPGNVLMMPDGIAKVTDFGLARARQFDLSADLLVSTAGGTPAFRSPEQVRRERLSVQTDIWSWGVTVLEMFAGEMFWQYGEAADEVLEGFLKEGAQAPGLPPMPEPVAALLRQCFQRDPADRPRDMVEIAWQVQEIYGQIIGHVNLRQRPKPTSLRASSLNNTALSYLDMGHPEKANLTWAAALGTDPLHANTLYNQGLFLWRSGKITDEDLLKRIQNANPAQPENWEYLYQSVLVHLERGDALSARQMLNSFQGADTYRKEFEAARFIVDDPSFNARFILITDFRSTNHITSLSLSKDGHYALSGDVEKTLRLWDIADGRCLRTFEGHTNRVNSVCLSADGRYALSGSNDHSLKYWEVKTGKCSRIFKGHKKNVTSVCLSADGRYALSGSWDKTLKLWEVDSGKCLCTLTGHDTSVECVYLSSDGHYALSGEWNKNIILWDVQSGHRLRTFTGHTDIVKSVCLSYNGRLALSASSDNTLKLWEVESGRCLRTFEGHLFSVKSAVFSADGHYAISCSIDKTLRLWEVESGRCLRTFAMNTTGTEAVCLSADGRFALSGGWDALNLWLVNLSESTPVAHYMLSRVDAIQDAILKQTIFEQTMNHAQLALEEGEVITAAKHLRLARAQPGFERANLALNLWRQLYIQLPRKSFTGAWTIGVFKGHNEPVTSVCLSIDGHYALSGSRDQTLKLWDISDGHCLRTFKGHNGFVSSVCLSADGQFALSGSYDQTLKLWELSSSRCLRTFTGHHSPVNAVCLSVDGRYAASGGGDKILILWDVESGRQLRTFAPNQDSIKSVCLSADGCYILADNGYEILKLWDVSNGRHIRSYKGIWLGSSTCLSGDGRYAMTASGSAKLWEIETGKCLRTFDEKGENLTSIALSSDGRYALTGGHRGTLKLWEVATGHCLHTFESHIGRVSSVCFSADGRYAMSGGEDKTIRLIALDWELEDKEQADWDDGAQPYLDIYLTQHTPSAGSLPRDRDPSKDEITLALTRRGKPTWTEEDFQRLIHTLGCAGYGWLRPEGVRRKLEEMAKER